MSNNFYLEAPQKEHPIRTLIKLLFNFLGFHLLLAYLMYYPFQTLIFLALFSLYCYRRKSIKPFWRFLRYSVFYGAWLLFYFRHSTVF